MTDTQRKRPKIPAADLIPKSSVSIILDQKQAREEREAKTGKKEEKGDPTRFGDWSVKGRCIDF